jgi:hypothetical protein
MIENYTIEFNECARVTAEELSLDEMEGRRYLNRLIKDNIAQITTLEALSRYPSTISRGQLITLYPCFISATKI